MSGDVQTTSAEVPALPAARPARVGCAAVQPDGLDPCQAAVMCECPAEGEVHYAAAACVIDGSLSQSRGDIAASLVTDQLESALRSGRAPTIGAGLVMALHDAAEALKRRAKLPHDPADLKCSAGVAVLDDGNWTFVEVGSTHVFLERGRAVGPVFRQGQVSDPPLGDEDSAPRVTTARALPGDQVLLLGGYTVGSLDVARAAQSLRVAPELGEGCKALVREALSIHHTPQALASIVLDRPPRRARAVVLPLLFSLAFMAAALGFAFLAWTGGPTRPIIPPEARSANLLPIAEQPQDTGVDVGGAPGLVDIDLPDVEAVPRDSGRVKVIGEPGLCFEVLDLATGESALEGEIREGQDSYISQGIPAPGQYSVTVWESGEKEEALVEGLEFHLERDAIRIVDSRRGREQEPAR